MPGKIVKVLLVLAVVIAIAATVYIVRFGLPQRGLSRTLKVQNISVVYTGQEALAVIVQCRKDGIITPWAYAMLGGSAGVLNLPQAFPSGADAILLFGLHADIALAGTPEAAPPEPIEVATLRGLAGAHSDEMVLQFRNPKDIASIALKPDGPPILLRVTSNNGKLVVGEQK